VIWEPGADRALSEDDRKAWDARIDRAEHVRKQHEPIWDKALKRYTDTKADAYDVNALLEFRHVESKKAQLFYQTPEVQLHPIDPANPEIPGEQILPLRQKVLNDRLGPDGTNVKRTVHEALFDCLAPSGFLVTEVGYDVRLAPARDEAGAPILGPDGQPTQVPIWGKPFWTRVSPKKLLIPDDFRSTNFDEAPWLALKLTMPLSRAKKEFALPEDFTGTNRDEAIFEHVEQTSRQSSDPLVEYLKVWYRAELFDASIVNPELFRLLILVKGHDTPVRHVDSPFQSIDAVGQLTSDSMRGNPIHLGTLRDLSDSAYIQSDLAVGAQLSNELGKFRTQLIRNREARMPLTGIDPMGLPAGEVEKIKNGAKVFFTNPGQLANGMNTIVAVATMGTEPRDNYTAQDMIERDWDQAMGRNANTSGQLAQQKRTATEVRSAQTGSSARAESEKDRLREWFIAGVRKFDSVLQRTMAEADLVKILGTQGALLWEQWRALPGCYVYKILPDSGVHVDAQQFRAQKIDEYNMFAKDPQFNGTEIRRNVARALGYDPSKAVLDQPPEAGPEPIKTSFAFKGEDLIGPQSQAVVEILAQMGITVSPAAIETLKAAQVLSQMAALANPDGGEGNGGSSAPLMPAKHGGTAEGAEPVSKHQRERTGGVNGVAA
jgi:hypothetical protein